MNQSTMIKILLLAAIALGLRQWVTSRQDEDAANAPLPDPRSDYTLTQFELLVMNTEGEPSFNVVAPYLEKNNDDRSLDINQPKVLLFNDDKTHWTITSDHGWISERADKLLLDGAVKMVTDSTERPALIEGTDFTIYPDDKQIESDQRVQLTRPESRYEGVGFRADTGLDLIEILSEVHADYASQ